MPCTGPRTRATIIRDLHKTIPPAMLLARSFKNTQRESAQFPADVSKVGNTAVGLLLPPPPPPHPPAQQSVQRVIREPRATLSGSWTYPETRGATQKPFTRGATQKPVRGGEGASCHESSSKRQGFGGMGGISRMGKPLPISSLQQ